MDIKQLKYFLDVAAAKSFTRAAARIRIAQPALSRQIRHLEEELGIALLIRHGKGVQLTDSGALLKRRAEILVRQLENIKEEVSAQRAEPKGEVTLGLPPSLGAMLSAPLIEKITQKYPGIFLRVTVGTSEALRESIITGKLDIGVLLSTEPTGPLVRTALLTEPMYMVGLASKWPDIPCPIKPRALSKVPLIITSLPHGIRILVEDYLAAHNIEPRVKLEVNNISLMIELTRRGVGFTILPRCALYDVRRSDRLRAERIDGLEISWMVTTFKEHYQPLAAKKVMTLLLEAAKKLPKDGFLMQ
ncbi:MAG: LysR family transcriptional regulator [Alphaproteobacteria bacterium]|nr:LysR family transcriptional regulator [Alphaproteobacteria bacterium]